MQNNSSCPRCQAKFHCGANEETNCWCCSLPALMPLPDEAEEASCYCPDCLKEMIEQQKSVQPKD